MHLMWCHRAWAGSSVKEPEGECKTHKRIVLPNIEQLAVHDHSHHHRARPLLLSAEAQDAPPEAALTQRRSPGSPAYRAGAAGGGPVMLVAGLAHGAALLAGPRGRGLRLARALAARLLVLCPARGSAVGALARVLGLRRAGGVLGRGRLAAEAARLLLLMLCSGPAQHRRARLSLTVRSAAQSALCCSHNTQPLLRLSVSDTGSDI